MRALARIFFLIAVAAAVALAVAITTSCATGDSAPEDLNWEFVTVPGQPIKACLTEKDLAKLREHLDWCEAK